VILGYPRNWLILYVELGNKHLSELNFTWRYLSLSTYLTQPERIQGHAYNIRSDLWSLGITLMEIAQMRFPFPPEGHPSLSPIDLVQYLLDTNIAELLQDDPDPDVPKWSGSFRSFLGYW